MNGNAKILIRIVLLIIIAGVIGAFYVLELGQYLSLAQLREQQQSLVAFREQNFVTLVVICFAVYITVAALSLPGATIMTLSVGAIFGFGWGLLIASFASTLGATLAFLIARFFLHDWVQNKFGDRLQKFNERFRKDGAFYLLTLRLVPLFPFFVVNLAMSLTKIKAFTFYWVSQVGMLAGTAVYVNAGTQLASIESTADIFSTRLLLSFTLLGMFPLIAKAILGFLESRRALKGWQKPKQFDRNLVVIGAGSAGLVSAYIAAATKAKVTLVEANAMGGDCLNTGCVPSKALINVARQVKQRNTAGMGLPSVATEVDFPQVMAHVQQVIKTIEPHDSIERYTELGVDVVSGYARIVSPWEVEIETAAGKQKLTTKAIIVATGGKPLVPKIPGIDQVHLLTSDSLWDLKKLPKRLLVMGGGPIGCELAQAFQQLGSAVIQVEMAERLLGKEDTEVSELLAEHMQAEGIDLRLQHRVIGFTGNQSEGIAQLEILDTNGKVVGHDEVAFDSVLVAVGRQANLKGFGLEELGIETTHILPSNEFMQTSVPTIYAAGDVTGPYQFTHTASHQAWYASVNALFAPLKKFKADYRVIPWATFTQPEIATVGMNEEMARAAGVDYEVTRYGIDDLDRAIADNQAYGFVKVLTKPGKDTILGVTIAGPRAGDLIAEFVLAMKYKIGLNKILGTIHIYPTMNEANKYVAGNWRRANAPAGALRWLERFHNWRR
ncbi:pyruvate/2-oxoglutarate dehydrogenase complex, dihydrolipoamide dehydrogenase component [Idiomarina sp. A28L]|uniref:FAD-dependent oxidoreductase n=1 Tax=Idiomarina sp. A28L TaxID=1036674 RepID=UPI0002138B6B|nr:bifunctional TVP38/TMEM64 family protein/FAD-dependent oxidoreductase [Idiomarina sp. A28L]EGN75932.1 pyruvate/2-oxoglutarate dehydrogenase complex, dihydrolipoamide dehydrogenase component [Idiomarina sp. A28L]